MTPTEREAVLAWADRLEEFAERGPIPCEPALSPLLAKDWPCREPRAMSAHQRCEHPGCMPDLGPPASPPELWGVWCQVGLRWADGWGPGRGVSYIRAEIEASRFEREENLGWQYEARPIPYAAQADSRNLEKKL